MKAKLWKILYNLEDYLEYDKTKMGKELGKIKEIECNFCESTEVTYNQLIMDSYCSDCGEWQQD